MGPQGRRAGRGHDRARRGGRRRPARRLAVAPRRGAGARPDRAAHLHHRLRQLPAAGRAADRPAQRARRRAAPALEAAEDAGSAAHPRRGDGASPARPRAPRPLVARAHHGSVSKEQRAIIEDDLKRGRLPCVVATSSLELGIDMGAVDLVVQIESPPSVASALQRVGRAGHQVGEVSRGVLFPKHRGDLVPSAVAVERMRAGGIEALHVPASPLDVLAQQVVAATSLDAWDADELFDVVRRSAPFATLPRSGVRRDARPALRPLPQRRVRRAAPAPRLGPRLRRADRPPGRPAAGRHQRRHHPRPRPVRRLPGRREGQPRSASSTRRWSTSRGSATCSPSARPAGASRTSPTTACWSRPRPASPGGCRSGPATPWAGPPSSARRSAPSPASSPR